MFEPRFAIVVALLVACRGAAPSVEPPTDVGSGGSGSAAPEPKPRVGPHSGAIERIAITDDATAAYTIDTFGQGRLWPTLDGTREPIVVRGGRPIRVVLAKTDDGLLAASLDQAGGLELVRFDRDGTTRGHVVLPPEPGFVDALAVPGGILAQRRDEALVWYDAGGRARGLITAEPGERIAALAVRHGRVIAAVTAADGGVSLRWIVVRSALAWGPRQPMRASIAAPIALSPSGTKVAAIDAATQRFAVVDLVTGEAILAKSEDTVAMLEAPVMGFLDDATAVFSDTRGTWWWTLERGDPWATGRRSAPSEMSDVAVGDGVMLDASSANLTLTTFTRMRWLGYRDIGPSVLWATATGVATRRGAKSAWFDRELRERVAEVPRSAVVEAVVGERHLVVSDASHVTVRDVQTKEEVLVGVYAEAVTVAVDPASTTLFVMTHDRLERFQIRSSPLVLTRLPGFALAKGVTRFDPIDPTVANGIVAVVSTVEQANRRVHWYREVDGATTEVHSVLLDARSVPFGTDARGVLYFRDQTNLLVMADPEHPNRTLPLFADEVTTGTPRPDGTLLVVASATSITAIDTVTGVVRWNVFVPGIETLEFSSDGATLFATAQSGMLSLDPATGTRLGTACGWNFGLHDEDTTPQVFGVPNLCAGLE